MKKENGKGQKNLIGDPVVACTKLVKFLDHICGCSVIFVIGGSTSNVTHGCLRLDTLEEYKCPLCRGQSLSYIKKMGIDKTKKGKNKKRKVMFEESGSSSINSSASSPESDD